MAEEEDEILRQVAEHAALDHGMREVPPELVESVRDNISVVTG